MDFPNLTAGGIKYLCLDLETYDPLLKDSGPGWIRDVGHIVGIGLGWQSKEGNRESKYFSIGSDVDTVRNLPANDVLLYIQNLASLGVPILYQKGQYDLGWLWSKAVNLLDTPVYDCMVGAQVINNQMMRYNLDAIAGQWLGQDKQKVSLESKYGPNVKSHMNRVAYADMEEYTLGDVNLEMDLHEFECTKFDEFDLWRAYELECKVIPITVRMKALGIAIDLELIEKLKKQFGQMEQSLLQGVKRALRIYDLNVWSAGDMEKVFKRLGLQYPRTDPTTRNPIGLPSFTSDYLGGIDSPCVVDLLKVRKLHRLRNGFLNSLTELHVNGRIHPDFYSGRGDDGGTVTGRFSCAHPNKQQIPIRTEEGALLRAIFLADAGRQWCCNDYSQQEPRLGVHYASKFKLQGIEYWVDKFREDPKADFYTLMTQIASIDRGDSKTITLAKSYGMGAGKMSRKVHKTEEESHAMLAKFDEDIPWMKDAMNKCIQVGKERGYIKSLYGRRLMLPKERPYSIYNHLLQGAAAEQMKQAMVNLWEYTGMIPSSQIHDELNVMVDSKAEGFRVGQLMKEAVELEIPVKVDTGFGENWKSAKEDADRRGKS